MKISIVIPVYNRKADLPRCFNSIASVYEGDYEIIAVDDASTDGSYELLQTLPVKNLRVFKNPENKGVNYTRNRGVEQATGQYILFLDSDDMLVPGGLDIVFNALNQHAQVKHFLFYMSDNVENKHITATYTTNYTMWLLEQVYGDFTHVLLRDILLKYPFFEAFRAYEGLNWLRIFRETSPQKVIPEVVSWRDNERDDNLTKQLRLKTTEAIAGKFYFLQAYFTMYGDDLYALDPEAYQKKLNHAILLGIGAYLKDEVKNLINASHSINKTLYRTFVATIPSSVLNTVIRNR